MLSFADLAKHGPRVTTIAAKAGFWALCFHFFGAAGLLQVVAAWAFMMGAKDLTFARVRLANMARQDKRASAMLKSAGMEAGLFVVRVALLLLIVALLRKLQQPVALLILGLIPVTFFWARDTMITLARVYRVNALLKYISMLAALAGLATIILLARQGSNPAEAAVTALLVREGAMFGGYALLVLFGRATAHRRTEASDEEEEEDEDGGSTVAAFDAEGREVRSTFKLFLADNAVYSRWRVMQLGSRVVANSLLGPFGGLATRLFFAYRKPSEYRHRADRMSAARLAMMIAPVVVMLAIGALIAERFGFIHAYGVAAVGFGFRAVALSLNLLVWRQLSTLVGREGKVRMPALRRRRRKRK